MRYLNILVLFLVTAVLGASEEVPTWVLSGILFVESSSFYAADGSIVYINHKRGRHGELGPFQCTKAAFKDIRAPGDSFPRLATDPAYAEAIAVRRLRWLQEQLGPDWDLVVRGYNAGATGARRGRGQGYLEDVQAAARRIAPGSLP
jgi:hypothetical protein